MEDFLNDFNNYVCLTFYENVHRCEIAVYNDDKVLYKMNVSRGEGEDILLAWCLKWKSLELSTHIDTIGFCNQDKTIGFVRYINNPGVIKELKEELIPKFLGDFLETLQRQYKKIKINSGYDYYHKPEIEILGESEEETAFYMTFKTDIHKYFPYVITDYMNRHENPNIQESQEDLEQMLLDNLEFSFASLTSEQREYFMSKIREERTSSYKSFITSSLGQKINEILDEQDGLQRIRINPNVSEDK